MKTREIALKDVQNTTKYGVNISENGSKYYRFLVKGVDGNEYRFNADIAMLESIKTQIGLGSLPFIKVAEKPISGEKNGTAYNYYDVVLPNGLRYSVDSSIGFKKSLFE